MINFDEYQPDDPIEDELLLEGDALPLDSIRSCELAVECWNLRNSLAEADHSYNYTKKDLKMQKYTLRRVQSELATVQKTSFGKDKILKEKNGEIEALNKKFENSIASRRCIISSIAKTEHCHKDILRKYNHLEVENVTIQSQLAEQERQWQEKYTSMELILTLDAQQAEKERDVMKSQLSVKDIKYNEADKERITLESQLSDLRVKYEALQVVNIGLEDKCVWGLELEQAYESLHSRLEVATADKAKAVLKTMKLERERNKVQSYALSEGLILPSFATDDD